jgi:nicotinamide-nucleotide amidase
MAMANKDIDLARLAARVGRHLRESGLVMATAESCTGGWISKALTDIAGSSDWFSEGFVTYSNFSKKRSLGVPQAVLQKQGAVSESTAKIMARGALRRSRADIVVAVTGIAGPGGAVAGKPVGTVWFAWAIRRGRRVQVTSEIRHFRGNRETVRRKTVQVALEGILRR